MVLGMNEPPSRYDVTVTVARDGGHLPDPAEFAVAAEKAASSRNASVMCAHTAEQIISIVIVQTADRPAAVAVAQMDSGICYSSSSSVSRFIPAVRLACAASIT